MSSQLVDVYVYFKYTMVHCCFSSSAHAMQVGCVEDIEKAFDFDCFNVYIGIGDVNDGKEILKTCQWAW